MWGENKVMTRKKIESIKPRISKIDMRQGSSVAVERIRGWKLTKIRERILLRDDYTCQQCGRVLINGEVDHIVPLHLGGFESDMNRQYLCKECHQAKTEKEEKDRGVGKCL